MRSLSLLRSLRISLRVMWLSLHSENSYLGGHKHHRKRMALNFVLFGCPSLHIRSVVHSLPIPSYWFERRGAPMLSLQITLKIRSKIGIIQRCTRFIISMDNALFSFHVYWLNSKLTLFQKWIYFTKLNKHITRMTKFKGPHVQSNLHFKKFAKAEKENTMQGQLDVHVPVKMTRRFNILETWDCWMFIFN